MHDCYKGIVFPAGVAPLPDDYFSGTRIMAQSVGIEKNLRPKGFIHSLFLKLIATLG